MSRAAARAAAQPPPPPPAAAAAVPEGDFQEKYYELKGRLSRASQRVKDMSKDRKYLEAHTQYSKQLEDDLEEAQIKEFETQEDSKKKKASPSPSPEASSGTASAAGSRGTTPRSPRSTTPRSSPRGSGARSPDSGTAGGGSSSIPAGPADVWVPSDNHSRVIQLEKELQRVCTDCAERTSSVIQLQQAVSSLRAANEERTREFQESSDRLREEADAERRALLNAIARKDEELKELRAKCMQQEYQLERWNTREERILSREKQIASLESADLVAKLQARVEELEEENSRLGAKAAGAS